jgi:hypothetical protein
MDTLGTAQGRTMSDAPAWQLTRLLDGYLVSQLLYVAAELGVADVLAHGSRPGEEIARLVGADAAVLTRVLRGLASEGVLEESDGRFGLCPIGLCLVGLSGAARVRGTLYYSAAAGLLDTVRGGGVPFERVHGCGFFEHLEHHRDDAEAFHGSMAGRAEQEARDVVTAYDFGGARHLVDVGGGRGIVLAAILAAHPDMGATLVDREAAIDGARGYLRSAGVDARAHCEAGDFFDAVPPGADAYLLSRVLHDWHDADAARILATCRRAMAGDARLLIVDALLPEDAGDHPAAIRMDLHMHILFGARERTEADFRRLLGRAGFRVHGVHVTGSPAGLAVIEARPAQPGVANEVTSSVSSRTP